MNTLGRVCTSVLSTQGTFAPDTANPRPADSMGCWPLGVWTFTAKVETNDCTPAPTLMPQYQFKVEFRVNEDGDKVQTFKYMTDPSVKNLVKVSEAAGRCLGALELFSPDGKSVWLFKPGLNTDNTIVGDGEYGVFSENQWPF